MDDPLLYPVEQLVQPLRRRFRYHFLEDRRTNLLEKPEWCFTQMSSWIRSHTPFLEKLVQPLLEAAGLHHVDAVDMVQDDLLMAHLIDELLLFNRELMLLGYPPSSPSPLSLLLDTTSFSKWIALERQYRYRNLPSEIHQLKFVGLQRDLILDFLHDIVAAGDGTTSGTGPLSPLLCSQLNGCSYITAVLREWGEMKFFVSLHYSEQDHTSSSSDHPLPTGRPDIDTILQLRRQDSAFAEVEGNVFSAVSSEFRTHSGVLQDRLVQQELERDAGEVAWQELSVSLSAVLPQLQGQLAFLRDHLSTPQFAAVFQRTANHIDQVLFSEVILSTHFGVGGANQLNFDLTAGFLPVLSQFCEDDLSARQLMERCRESCRLLTLFPGSAKLLQELLVGVVRGGATTPIETYTAAVTTLNEFGVHTLEPVQAYQILSNMIVQQT
ncbi:RAD50-interacting protein 1 [Geodia barretti]|uniref:RAD50-interacting protein 1 n=1 Tax=Geodia barretti TaxID=519541 RepID=A0AA35WBK7_GEOBA|nr:RAD50-interacting protein 1 [Geodia barretti]